MHRVNGIEVAYEKNAALIVFICLADCRVRSTAAGSYTDTHRAGKAAHQYTNVPFFDF